MRQIKSKKAGKTWILSFFSSSSTLSIFLFLKPVSQSIGRKCERYPPSSFYCTSPGKKIGRPTLPVLAVHCHLPLYCFFLSSAIRIEPPSASALWHHRHVDAPFLSLLDVSISLLPVYFTPPPPRALSLCL